jgi:hypothetical protein
MSSGVKFEEEEKKKERDPRFSGPVEVDEEEEEEEAEEEDEEGGASSSQVGAPSPRVATDVDFEDDSQVEAVMLKARPAVHAHLQALARKSVRHRKVKHGRPKHTSTHLTYQTKMLFTWEVLVTTKGTILSDKTIMWYLFSVSCLALGAGVVASIVVADPHKLSTTTLFNIIDYTKLFLAFMLGLYMAHCVTRWWNSVSSIVDFFHAIKTLVFFCNALDVNVAKRDTIERLCIMSCYLLEIEISGFYSSDESNTARWLSVKEFLIHEGLANAAEIELLEDVEESDRSSLVWTWIGAILGTLDVAPPLKTTAVKYGQIAIASMKSVKFYVTMQLPFIYSHMLALLVHANNMALAIASGIAVAVLIFEANHQIDLDRTSKVYRAVQGISIQLLAMLLQPAVYEAFITVGALLADPFTNETHGLPMLDYVQDLRRQIGELNALAAYDEKWLKGNAPGSPLHSTKSTLSFVVADAIASMREERRDRAEKLSPRSMVADPMTDRTEITPRSTPPLTLRTSLNQP